jgi:hypothetical protein
MAYSFLVCTITSSNFLTIYEAHIRAKKASSGLYCQTTSGLGRARDRPQQYGVPISLEAVLIPDFLNCQTVTLRNGINNYVLK